MKKLLSINNQFIPYNLALKLKELGFNEDCFGYYRKKDLLKLFNLQKYKGTNQDLENLNYELNADC